MVKMTILIDPDNNYEMVEDAATLTAEFNANNLDHAPMTEQDFNDLNEMFLKAGLLVKMSIQ